MRSKKICAVILCVSVFSSCLLIPAMAASIPSEEVSVAQETISPRATMSYEKTVTRTYSSRDDVPDYVEVVEQKVIGDTVYTFTGKCNLVSITKLGTNRWEAKFKGILMCYY